MQLELIKNYLISIVRTLVPMVVGAVTGWLATKGITFNEDGQHLFTLLVETVFGVVYYAVVRGLEFLNYRFGWLLGYARMPVYTVSAMASQLSKSDDDKKPDEQ